jgi:glutamate:GABA antiporter
MARALPASVQEPADRTELRSEEYVVKTMPATVGSLDLTATFVLIIFFITNSASAIEGGAGTFTFWVVGGLTFFIPCVIATAQLGRMFPHEGSLYNWTHRAFGGYWSFFVGFCAWFPGVLLMVVAADVIVVYIQGLNPGWLTAPWQQGLLLVLLLAFSGVMAIQRFRTILNIVKVVLAIAFLAVLIVGIAGVVWLLKGNHPAVAFNTPGEWGLHWNPSGYYSLALFGFITQAYLGIEVPLNMGGEISGRRVITRHLLWGAILVLVGYLVTSFAILVVLGTAPSGNPFALVLTVDTALGKTMGSIVAILIMCNFVITPIIYNYSYARLLMVGGIDQRLPVNLGRLNKNRVPANAIIFQTVVAMIFTVAIYIVAPSLTSSSNAATLNSQIYNVVISASTLVWAISTAFLFINLAKFYFSDRRAFRRLLLFPMPVLWACMVLGTLACAVSIYGTLIYSLIPAQIDNQHWWYIVGGITFVCLIVAALGSMLAHSEADWQKLSK